MCTITGEPFHDIIALRKLVSPHKNDGRDFVFDHIELINRLSSEPPPIASSTRLAHAPLAGSGPGTVLPNLQPSSSSQASSVPVETREDPLATIATQSFDLAASAPAERPDSPVRLGNDAHGLLRRATIETSCEFQQTLQQEQQAVDSPNWKEVFKCHPPRGTMARIARRLDVKLHPRCGPHQWQTLRDFTTEVKRIKRFRWCKRGHKSSRPRRGIKRCRTAKERLCGINVVVTKKTLAHYTSGC